MNNDIINGFADAINRHDVLGILGYLSDDHLLIDAYGQEITGHKVLAEAWYTYFKWFPDYKIEIQEIICGNDIYALFGFAQGTFQGEKMETNERHWRLPVAWKAVVAEEKICLWQVYCDSKIPYSTMA